MLVIGWMIVIATVLTMALVNRDSQAFLPDCQPMPLAEAVVLAALGRPVWALCIAWIIVVCATGHAGRSVPDKQTKQIARRLWPFASQQTVLKQHATYPALPGQKT